MVAAPCCSPPLQSARSFRKKADCTCRRCTWRHRPVSMLNDTHNLLLTQTIRVIIQNQARTYLASVSNPSSSRSLSSRGSTFSGSLFRYKRIRSSRLLRVTFARAHASERSSISEGNGILTSKDRKDRFCCAPE